ncbi:hypothetical protein BKA61DRAFT_617995 [Leptodontidium sp. MPI-SDFR-AT-0119]|nr:hypothetical protein BKA61DRAFT_617995 [Leptodontidium sp. MPI-SDFR-AT-0119]
MATVKDLTQVFNMSNHRERSTTVVRTKLRMLGMSRRPVTFPTMPATLRDLASPKRSKGSSSFKISMKLAKPLQRDRPLARYEWGVLELGVFLPLHPLLAEARQHAAKPQTPRYPEDLYVALPWLSTLGKDTILKLKCGEKDKLALQQYMEYLGSWKAKSTALRFSLDAG